MSTPKAPFPSGEFKFRAIKEFEYWREDSNSQDGKRLVATYYPGPSTTYNCTLNPVHDHLREQCKQWYADGLIEIMPLPHGARMKMINRGG